MGQDRALFFYLDLLKLMCCLRGKLCQELQHLAEVDCKSYTDTFYFCSALICWLVLSLFQKNDHSGVFNEKQDFKIINLLVFEWKFIVRRISRQIHVRVCTGLAFFPIVYEAISL